MPTTRTATAAALAAQAWDQLVSLGEDLMVDPVAVVLEDCSPHEIKRLEELIGRNFG